MLELYSARRIVSSGETPVTGQLCAVLGNVSRKLFICKRMRSRVIAGRQHIKCVLFPCGSASMRNPGTIHLRKVIVHILDNSAEPVEPTLSDVECPIDETLNDFFAAHIQKALDDENAKIAKFSNQDGAVRAACIEVFERNGRFIRNSKRLAQALFVPMRQTRAISPGDMVVCLYETENYPDQQFLGIFKMDLSSAFTHTVRRHGNEVRIEIRPQGNVLPSPKQRLQKCVFIRPPSDDYDMVILDNQIAHLYDTSGVANFFCRTFLECELWQSSKDKTKLFRSLTSKWVKQNYEHLEPAQADLITSAARTAILSDSVNVREFANVTIPDRDLRNQFLTYLRENRLEDLEFTPDHEYAERATRKKKYKADGGIVVSGDADEFDEIVTVNNERDAENRFTITIKTTRWTEEVR